VSDRESIPPFEIPASPAGTKDTPKLSPAHVHGLNVGLLAGVVCGALGFLAYYLENGDHAAPWAQLGTISLVYAVLSGGLIGMLLGGGIAATDRLLGGRRAFSPILGATPAGALGGVLPGAFGAAYFGARNAPFMRGGLLVALPILAVASLTLALVDRDRRAAGAPRRLARTAALTLLVAGILAAASLGLVLTLGDEALLEQLTLWSEIGLAPLGAVLGAAIGAALGLYVGIVAAIDRLVTDPRLQSQAFSSDSRPSADDRLAE
jgi:hypothetical protein